MSVELESLEGAIADFDRDADDDFVDPGRLSAVIDRLQGKLCRVLAAAKKRGDHLLTGQSSCAWVASTCRLSGPAASDRPGPSLAGHPALMLGPRNRPTLYHAFDTTRPASGSPIRV